jgi:DHA1 family bicyclomycin/chloramphenicol resistance-like MFS transporter
MATKLTGPLLVTLGLIGVLGPFGTDIYLPAMPQMAAAMKTDSAGIQLTLTAFTIGMAIGQLIMGSASDRIGRKPLITLGCVVMTLASLVAASAQELFVLIFSCAFIGVSASAGMVCGRAIISDLAISKEAARGFSLMGLVAGLGPIFAPLAGAGVLLFGDWRTIFAALAALSCALAVVAIFRVPETLAQERRHSGGFKQLIRAAGGILRNRNFMWHAGVLWTGFGMMFAYISASPFVLESIFGLTPFEYTLDFGGNGIIMMVTGFVSARLINRFGPSQQIRFGVSMQVGASILLLAAWLIPSLGLVLVIAAFALIPSSLGFVFGPVTALALRDVRHASGTALALMGSVQFLLAGVTAFLVGLGGAKAMGPLVAVLLVLAGLGLASITTIRLGYAKTQQGSNKFGSGSI